MKSIKQKVNRRTILFFLEEKSYLMLGTAWA